MFNQNKKNPNQNLNKNLHKTLPKNLNQNFNKIKSRLIMKMYFWRFCESKFIFMIYIKIIIHNDIYIQYIF